MASEVVLSYKLKCFPTRNKADTLALLSAHFRRLHSLATQVIAETGKWPTSRGRGEFVGRTYRRAWTDYKRGQKAARALKKDFVPGILKAELIDAAHVQAPRNAKSFELWVMVQGVGKLSIPAKKHRAINRTLALPGATLCEQGEVFRKNGKWYVRVGVKVPLPEGKPVREFIGVDVGVRRAITCSDGYRSRDLRPLLKRQRDRRALDQQQGRDRSYEMSPRNKPKPKTPASWCAGRSERVEALGLKPRIGCHGGSKGVRASSPIAVSGWLPGKGGLAGSCVRPLPASPVLLAARGIRVDTRRNFGA